MSIVLRSLLRDPLVTRPLTRALRRFDDDWWLDDAWPAKRIRRVAPEYDAPAVLLEDMNRQMAAAMNRIQEFAEDLEALDTLAGRVDKQNLTRELKGNKKRVSHDEIAVKRTESGSLQLDLDVSDFKPEDLKIKLVDDNLIVEAVNENSGKNSYSRSHFKRWFKLPEDCKVEEIKSKLTEDNRLVIDLPSNRPAVEQKTRTIPIEMTKPTQEQNNASENNTTSINQENQGANKSN